MRRLKNSHAALYGLLITMFLTGCDQQAGGVDRSGASRTSETSGHRQALPFTVTASIQELMQYEVDTSADAIWDAAGTTLAREGLVEKRPQSDDEWKALRQHAVVLLEATNLLAIPGRRIALKEFPSDGPGVFSSQEIEAEVARRQQEFDAFAQGLRASGQRVLSAVDSRDVEALLKEGAAMDGACEACHRSFWYPHEVIPALPAELPPIQ